MYAVSVWCKMIYQLCDCLIFSNFWNRPCPPDALPYMGQISEYNGAYINAGHNCWGIAWAPACGKAMSELVMDGESRCINLAPFSPMRFSKRSNVGRGRKKKGTSVGEQW